MYAVMKQNNSDMSGKPTVVRHSFRNDSARCMELLLLPTLFSSILAALLNILTFVRETTDTMTQRVDPSRIIVRYRFMLLSTKHRGRLIRRFSASLACYGLSLRQRRRIITRCPWLTRSIQSHGDRGARYRERTNSYDDKSMSRKTARRPGINERVSPLTRVSLPSGNKLEPRGYCTPMPHTNQALISRCLSRRAVPFRTAHFASHLCDWFRK